MASLSNVGIPGVGDAGILQPKQKNKWRVIFTGLADSGDISVQAITVSRPNLTFEEVELHRYNSKVVIAGKHSWEPVSLTVEDDISSKAHAALTAQSDRMQSLIDAGTGADFLPAAQNGNAYKFGLKIQALNGDDAVLDTWTLEGCWFQSLDFTELDYSASDAVQINMNIRYDHAKHSGKNKVADSAVGGFGE